MATSTVALNVAAKAAGKLYFGSATDNRKLNDPAYLSILKDTDIFGQLTPENSMKWDAIEPQRNVFNFTGGDQIVALAEETGKVMRGHALVWFQQLPDWVMYGTWTSETLTSVVENHVRTQVSHYRGKIYAWDVVNEPFNGNGTMRADVFHNTLGKSYISTALRAARAADPNAKLYLNDYDLEYAGKLGKLFFSSLDNDKALSSHIGPKVDAMVQLVEDLLAAGVPIDGIGFQCHYILGQVDPYQLRTNMERFTALGLEVAVTELDDRIPLPVTDADLYQQKSDYMAIVQSCMTVPRCVGVTVWDFPDKVPLQLP
ncbi:glycoside hydrolase family 10 protein [Chiua virens]|nr:glycoside hydrolase family 10 protein [Chiua virens]